MPYHDNQVALNPHRFVRLGDPRQVPKSSRWVTDDVSDSHLSLMGRSI